MRDWKEVALPCFIGGALFTAMALILAPQFRLLAVFAGFSGGYLSYRFSEVRRAFALAVKFAARAALAPFVGIYHFLTRVLSRVHLAVKGFAEATAAFFRHPIPFFWPSLLVFFLTTPWWWETLAHGMGMGAIIGRAMAAAFLPYIVLKLLAHLGIERRKLYWFTPDVPEAPSWDKRPKEYKPVPLTYPSAYKWVVLGIPIALYNLVRATWALLVFSVLATRYTLRYIHSHERLLCGIDGTLGGLVAYWVLRSHAVGFEQKLLLVLMGGLIGAAIGVANWEVVSVRILKIPVRNA